MLAAVDMLETMRLVSRNLRDNWFTRKSNRYENLLRFSRGRNKSDSIFFTSLLAFKMPKTISGDEGDGPRRFIPRPRLLCTLNIQDHYLEELEAKAQMWEHIMPTVDSKPRK